MRKYTTHTERQCYELGMQAGRKELEPTYTALLAALKFTRELLGGPARECIDKAIALAERTVQA